MKKLLCIVLTLVMFSCMPLTALAADNNGNKGTITVNGSLQNTATETEYNITFATTVNWFVTDNSYPEVWNDAETKTTDPYKIVNNTPGSEVKLTLTSFKGDSVAATIAEDLELHLTGALAADGMGAEDISLDYLGTTEYTTTLKSGESNAWVYGFEGSYSGTILKTAVNPIYTMEMSFSFV